METCYGCLSTYLCHLEGPDDSKLENTLSKFSNVLVSIGLTGVGFFLWLNPRFKRSPYPLIALACLAEGMQYFLNITHFIACDFKLPHLFVWSEWPLNKMLGLPAEITNEQIL